MEQLVAGMLANQLVEFYKSLGPEMPAGLDLSLSDQIDAPATPEAQQHDR